MTFSDDLFIISVTGGLKWSRGLFQIRWEVVSGGSLEYSEDR